MPVLLTMQSNNQSILEVWKTGGFVYNTKDCSYTDDVMAALVGLQSGPLNMALASQIYGISEDTMNVGLISMHNSGELMRAAVVKGHPGLGKCLKVTDEDGGVNEDSVEDNPDSNENEPDEGDDVGEGEDGPGEHEEGEEDDDEEEGEEEGESDSDDGRDYDEGDDDSEDTSDTDIDDEEEGGEEEEEADPEVSVELAKETSSVATPIEKGTAAEDAVDEKVEAANNEVGSPPRKKKK
ncbi:unnamed protein product [Orchesella dallaii]|uniref:Uncharacterized protein n=1 Tax=Orchesella dallaii TaxID=48710 RepID=A0ABP1RBY8_9HEXA